MELISWFAHSNRSKYGSFFCPAEVKAGSNRQWTFICFFSPSGYSLSHSVYSQIVAGSFVIRLLFGSGPPDISRLVVSIIVNSIQRMLVTRGFSYIFRELLKTTDPRIVHRNTSCPIIIVGRTPRIKATLFYGKIALVNLRGTTSVPFSCAATACYRVVEKIASLNLIRISTVALTQPQQGVFLGIRRITISSDNFKGYKCPEFSTLKFRGFNSRVVRELFGCKINNSHRFSSVESVFRGFEMRERLAASFI